MPTFSPIELRNLVEPSVRDTYRKPPTSDRVTSTPTTAAAQPPPAPRHIYISPALYATPDPAPIPDTVAEALSPSPYVVNHKRRGTSAFRKAPAEKQEKDLIEGEDAAAPPAAAAEEVDDNFFGGLDESVADEKVAEDGYLDPRGDSVSLVGEKEVFKQFHCLSVASAQGEFFDAYEDFGSESGSSTPSYRHKVDSELSALRLSLLEEIGKRKDAEDALNSMQCQWERTRDSLFEVGIRLPAITKQSGCIQRDDASAEDFSRELIISRYVAKALGRAEARVEAELAAETVIRSKDQEISRLRNRLQYYEAVNHEMSQRNQGIMEVARRERKKTQTRWFWSSIGASAFVGISLLAYTYKNKHQAPSYSKS